MHLVSRARTSIALLAMFLSVAAPALAADLIITGTAANDTLTGTAEPEAIYGRGGDDSISGGGGDDDLDGGPGSDLLRGGEGRDAVSYGGSVGVEATIDGVADDGTAGEKDNIGLDVEDLFGTESDDKLTGSAAANTLDGAGGADRLDGGPGPDVLIGGDGPDTITARDAEIDRIECGGGFDSVTVDLVDVVAADCESIAKPQLTAAPGLTLISKRPKKLILSTVLAGSAVRIYCVAGKGCKGKVVDVASVKLGKGNTVRFKLPEKIKGAAIEIGVRAPDASPVCVRFKITKSFRYSTDKKTACTTAAKDV